MKKTALIFVLVRSQLDGDLRIDKGLVSIIGNFYCFFLVGLTYGY